MLNGVGEREEAREVAGLMCADPDADMLPPFMAPLIAELDAANVCTGICGGLAACCRAFVASLRATTGTAIDVSQICGAIERLAADESTSDETCAEIMRTYERSLENLPNATVPPECHP